MVALAWRLEFIPLTYIRRNIAKYCQFIITYFNDMENGKVPANDIEEHTNIMVERPRRSFKMWCKKYFWEGQILYNGSPAEDHQDLIHDHHAYKQFLSRYRRIFALTVPALVFHLFWWAFMIKRNLFHIYVDKYFMPVTMVFGSLIAGMTSEAGGAIAFPVMTLAFQISPVVARDFSLMVQSLGLTCAAAAIFLMRVQLEWVTLVCASTGGVAGMILGLHFVDPYLTPAQKKMGFVSVWFSFSFALFLLNRYRKRKTFHEIQDVKAWKIVVLLLTGVFGGMCTSFAGNGLDICTFSMLTLLFRVSEKVATPTSVVLMPINSMVGWFWRALIMQAIDQEAYDFTYICAGVVTIGAPIGSVLGSHFHRLVLAGLIYFLDTVTLITAFVVVPQTPALMGASIGIIAGGFGFFYCITYIGTRMITEKPVIVEFNTENDPTEDPTPLLP